MGGIFSGGAGTSGLFGMHSNVTGQQADLSQNQTNFGDAILRAQKLANESVHNQGYVSDQGNALIQALQAQAAGQGPSIAQNQLNQTTEQNVNRGVAQAASAKGVDPALAARMGLDATAQANQAAAGQGATLRAQERLGALGQLGGAIGQQSQTNLGLAGLGGQMASNFGQLQNQQNANAIDNAMRAQGITAQTALANSQAGQAMTGGLMSGIGGLMGGGAAGKAFGGEIKGYDSGGPVLGVDMSGVSGSNNPFASVLASKQGPSLGVDTSMPGTGINKPLEGPNLGIDYSGVSPTKFNSPTIESGVAPIERGAGQQQGGVPSTGTAALAKGMGDFMAGFNGENARAIGEKGMSMMPMLLSNGGLLPGDHPKNDIVPAMLSPGEIVIPRSIAQSPDAAEMSAKFVAAIKKNKGKK
jgi:hypothetical protein